MLEKEAHQQSLCFLVQENTFSNSEITTLATFPL
jgi:hypothetical protein